MSTRYACRAQAAIVIATLAATVAVCGELRMFDRCDDRFLLPSSRWDNQLYIGSLSDQAHELDTLTLVMRMGYDFPLLSWKSAKSWSLGAGLAPLFHLYMFPEGSLIHIDNFYAVLSLYLAGTVRDRFAWRLYPIYHLSAHLCDGAPVEYTTQRNKVSNELIYANATWQFWERLEGQIGAGWCYHDVADDPILGRVDAAATYEPLALPALGLYVRGEGEVVFFESGARPGGMLQAGVRLHGRRSREMDIALTWFNRPHPGQYYKANERGLGCSFTFAFNRPPRFVDGTGDGGKGCVGSGCR